MSKYEHHVGQDDPFNFELIPKTSEVEAYGSYYSFDNEGRLILVSTPSNPNLNSIIKLVPNPSEELVAATHEQISRAREALAELFAEEAADRVIEETLDNAWLRDIGINPS